MTEIRRDTMDFFGAQDIHRRNTAILLVYFAISVTVTATVAYLSVLVYWFVFNKVANFWRDLYEFEVVPFEWWDIAKYYYIAAPCALILVSLSIWKTRRLAAPIDEIMPMIGATEVDRAIKHPPTKVYLDIVEEMSIASRTPMPRTFVIPREYGINAMAVGWAPDRAAIAVSAGAIQMLSRDEMQGVVGHEFSHILNGDMAMNVRLLGVLYGIDCIGVVGRIFFNFLIRSGRLGIPGHSNVVAMGAWVAMFLSLPLALLSWLGVLFGQLIRAAISRQREYLADASAVQFTRFPDGIAGALTKIGGLTVGSSMHGTALVASHFFLASAIDTSSRFLAVSSHPPLANRIARITPDFDGQFPYIPMHYEAKMGDPKKAAWRPGTRGSANDPSPAMRTESGADLSQDDLTSALTTPHPEYETYVRQIFRDLPGTLLKAASVPESAILLIYAAVLSHDDARRASEIAAISEKDGPDHAAQVTNLSDTLKAADPAAEVPLLHKAFRSISELSDPELVGLHGGFSQVFQLDQIEDSVDYVFPAAIQARLAALSGKRERSGLAIKKIARIETEIVCLACFLLKWKKLTASSGEKVEASQLALPVLAGIDLERTETSPGAIREACAMVARAEPAVKREVITLMVKVLAPNGVISAADAEMIWLMSELIRSRIPPLMPGELTKRLKR